MEREPRFGEMFYIDTQSRMDVLKETESLPEYVELSREVRNQLRKSIETEGWPECPKNIESVEDLFNGTKQIVSERWVKYTEDLLANRYREWVEMIPKTDKNKELIEILSNPGELEKMLLIRQLGVLEDLRKVLPEAWRSLVLISSERQLASIVLLRRWIKEIPDENLERLGVNRNELELFVDAAGILGKYIDHAYVKQIELADLPGGSSKTKLGKGKDEKGAEYLYDLYTSKDSNDIEIKPYVEVFSFEWPRLVRRFDALAERVEDLLSKGKIPEKYRGLPEYLQEMAKTYGSDEISPQSLNEKWNNLTKMSQKLTEKDCPIMFIPQGCAAVAGEADKVDTELRLGFRTRSLEKQEKFLDNFREIAQQIVDKNREVLNKPYQVPRVMLNHQPFAFGPNLYWMTRGEEGERAIVSHTNAVEEVALMQEFPLLKKMFLVKTDEAKYKNAATIGTALHEMGHAVMSTEDKTVHKRVGSSPEANILEELKAETLEIKLINEHLKSGSDIRVDAEMQFISKLGTICDSLANKSSKRGGSGERYHYAAVAIIYELLKEGVISKTDGKYQIMDSRRGLEVIWVLADKILEIYTDPKTTPKDVRQYIGEIRKIRKDKQVKEFIGLLKG